MIGYAVVFLALLAPGVEIGCWALWSFYLADRQLDREDQRASPVYAGAEWAREFWQEETQRQKTHKEYVPFRLWGVTNWHSKHINNDQGVGGVWRRTINPPGCDSGPRLTVWIFGGSTVYGTAVPDWATIPSYLSGELNAFQGACVTVSNYGVEGYVIDQELILLEEQIKAGGHPDIVVFYDGVNDSALAWPPGSSPTPHSSFASIKSRVEGTAAGRLDFLQNFYTVRVFHELLARLRPARSFSAEIAKAQPNVISVINNYEANVRVASAIAEAYKFKVYFFWQPILVYGHKPLVPFEERMAIQDTRGTSMYSAWLLTMASVYREAERRAAMNRDFVYLGDLFHSTPQPVYIDEAHLGPQGNQLAARALASYIHDHSGK